MLVLGLYMYTLGSPRHSQSAPDPAPLEMIGVQEDLLNIFLATHGLLLLTNLALGLLFFLFLCVRHHPAFKDHFRYLPAPAYNWLTRGSSSSPEQVQVEPVRRRRRLGWF